MNRYTPDTIAAIATPPGEGAIGIVRLSGPAAIAIVASLFQSSRGHDLANHRGAPLHGVIRDESGPVDEVLVQVSHAPHSYTCEDVVEIHCHGGMAPVNAILELVLMRGARIAHAGEFTKRAFLNGRIDLVQAEAVIDRIQAGTKAALRAAHTAAGGQLSKTIHAMSEQLAESLARIEAAIDFPDEDLPELVDEAMRTKLQDILAEMRALIATADAGRLYREGASVAIAGRPNVGKSSLFNALVRDARAIVTPHAGTTRDRLDEIINIGGIPVRLSDTAGVRDAADEVERIGVERARDALRGAEAILLVHDASEPLTDEDRALSDEVFALGVPVIVVQNKIDLAPGAPPLPSTSGAAAVIQTAAMLNQGIHELEQALKDVLTGGHAIDPAQTMITRTHQRDSLRRAADALTQCLANFNASPEFLAIDLRDAVNALGEITGDTTTEDLLDRIFSKFCIGK